MPDLLPCRCGRIPEELAGGCIVYCAECGLEVGDFTDAPVVWNRMMAPKPYLPPEDVETLRGVANGTMAAHYLRAIIAKLEGKPHA